MDKVIIFIFGHLNITKEDFEKEYVPIINLYCSKEEYNFIICDAKGVDSESQKYLASVLSKEDQEKRITIYHMFDNPREYHCFGKLKGNFKTDNERDNQATIDSHIDIAFSKRKRSGTEKSLKRREKLLNNLIKENKYDVINIINKYKLH